MLDMNYQLLTMNYELFHLTPLMKHHGESQNFKKTPGPLYKKSKIILGREPNALRRMPLRNLYETTFPSFFFDQTGRSWPEAPLTPETFL